LQGTGGGKVNSRSSFSNAAFLICNHNNHRKNKEKNNKNKEKITKNKEKITEVKK
jgi:hypothetical protein